MTPAAGASAPSGVTVPNTPVRPEFLGLESLRGIAALIVVIFHAGWTNPITALNFFKNSALMVDFFFVLSGFVIFYSYGNKLQSLRSVGRFLWLRFGRLYPLHFAFLCVFLGIEIFKLAAEKVLGFTPDTGAFKVNDGYAFLNNLLLIHSLGFNHTLTYNYPSWSISTEFYAYVLFAIVRSCVANTRLFNLFAGCIVAASCIALLKLDYVPLTNANVDWGYLRCCLGFFLGTLAYAAYSRCIASEIRCYSWVSFASLLMFFGALSSIDPNGIGTYCVPFIAAGVVLSMALTPTGVVQSLLASDPLLWLGRVSYSLYMVHAAVNWLFTQILAVVLKFPKIEMDDGIGISTPAMTGSIVLCMYVVAVLFLSSYTYRWIEEPFRKWSRRVADAPNHSY